MEYIGKVYYINLEHRIARDEEFLNEMVHLRIPSDKIHRIDAVYNPNFGAIGCCLSHVKAISLFIESNDKYCIIFEDDFKSLVSPGTFHSLISKVLSDRNDFDIILFDAGVKKFMPASKPYLKRILKSYGTGGYLLTKKFAPVLLKSFMECKERFDSRTDWQPHALYPELCIDRNWNKIQEMYRFYTTIPMIGCQREGFSDIDNKHKPQNNLL